MKKFVVEIAETRHYQITVDADHEPSARHKATKIWQDAGDEVGIYRTADNETEILFVLEVVAP